MALRIGDQVPNFEAETSQGKIDFYDWIGDRWALLFSHPADYTPVCTTELGMTAKLTDEFKARNVVVSLPLHFTPLGTSLLSDRLLAYCLECG